MKIDMGQCKPCPFCGNSDPEEIAMIHDTVQHVWGPQEKHNVTCSCGATGPDANTKEEAIQKWDGRQDEN